jgi:oligopeptide transport system substrate-binding protein
VDRERLVGEVFMGHMDPASGGLVPPGMPGHSPGIALPYDPQQARQLLAQAGYPDGQEFPGLELEGAPWSEHLAEYLISQWRHHLNVEVSYVATEWKEHIERKHLNDLTFGGWAADYPDPDNFLRICVRGGLPNWHNESYDRLLDRAQRSTNQVDRMRLYQAADKILIEEVAIMPLLYERSHVLLKPWVKVSGGSFNIFYLKNIIIEPH